MKEYILDVEENALITYRLPKDKSGLLCYYKPKHFYHIHSDELTPREKEIHKQLLEGINND